MKTKVIFCLALLLWSSNCLLGQLSNQPGTNGIQTYVNPTLPGDHPDQTILKMGNDFYTTGSNFHFAPYLPILHSNDLLHWKVIARVIPTSSSIPSNDAPSAGTWEGALAYFNNKYWVYFSNNAGGGQYFCNATNPAGPWSAPVRVNTSTGVYGYDNSVFVDDDGTPYMLLKNGQDNNGLQKLGMDGQPVGQALNMNWINSNGHPYSWAEGPVMCKRNGRYYLFVAGDVSGGQYVLSSAKLSNVESDWTRHGSFWAANTSAGGFTGPNHITNPVMVSDGSWWCLSHAYDNGGWEGQGRQSHLHRVNWDANGVPKGEPVSINPVLGPGLANTSGYIYDFGKADYFESSTLSLNWHFFNKSMSTKYTLSERPGFLRLKPGDDTTHILQKDKGKYYSLTTKLDFNPTANGQEAGLRLMSGSDLVYFTLYSGYNNGKKIGMYFGGNRTEVNNTIGNQLWLRIERSAHILTAYYSGDGVNWTQLGTSDVSNLDKSQPDWNKWVGTSVGLYAMRANADFDMYSYRYGFVPLRVEGRNNWYGVTFSSKTPGRTVTNSTSGDWLMMAGVDLGSADAKAGGIEVNVASAATNSSLEVWLDNIGGNGTKVATISIPNTGGADTWKNVSASFTASGQHDVYLRWVGGANSFLVNTIRFLPDVGPDISFTSPAAGTTFAGGATITLSATATTSSGSITDVKFYNGTTLLASDNTAPYSFNWANVPAGTYTLRAVATDSQGKTAEATETIKVNVPQGPYNGTAHVIPGTIQFEEYDAGGNGYAYYDATAGNTGGASFRTDEDVDIENCTDAGGGYNIGWATAGEWLEYTVNVQTTGVYNMDLRVACNGDGRTLSVSMDGTNIASSVAIPNTADWQTWQTVRVSNISLTAGQKIMRLTIGATDYINLNYVTFSLSTPPVAMITAVGATTFCAGGSVLLNASTGTGYTYQWKKDGSNIASATSSSYTATESGSYTVAVSANSQTVTSEAVSVTAKAIPAAPVVSTPVSYCQNATASALTATGSNLKWYTVQSGGTGSATAPTPSTSAAGSNTYYVSQTENGCEGPRVAIAVTVNGLPVITPYVQTNGGAWLQQSTAQLCAGGSVVLGPQPVTATGWSWTGPNGFTSASREISLANITAGQGGVYTAIYTTNGCSATQTFNITVNAVPDAPVVTSPVTYCQNATASPLTATGSNLKWYTVQSGGTSSATAPIPSTATAGTTNYYVSQSSNGCESARATISVTVNAAPNDPVVTSPVTYCQNASAAQLTATGSDLKWYTVQSGGPSSATAPIPSTATAGTTNYYVSQSPNGCESARAMIAVTVNASPNAPVVTSPVTYCQNASATPLTATGSDLKWYTVQSGGTSSATAPTPSTTIAGTTNYYVSQSANGCESVRATIAVTVNAAPNAPVVTSPVTYCQNVSAAQLTATGSDLKWYTVQSGGTSSANAPAPSTAATGTTNYYVSQSANGCESVRATIAVTVNAAPNAPVVTSPVTYCQNVSAAQLTATGSDLKWYTVQSGGTSSATAPTPSTTIAGTTNYYVSQSTNGCESARATIEVTVNTAPDAVITPSGPTTFAVGGSVTLNANTGTGLSYHWFNGSTQVSTSASYVATASGSYAVEVSNSSGCKATSSPITVSVTQNQPSVITIVSPGADSTIVGPITIKVTATDPDGEITKVEYLDGTTVIGTSTSSPYSFTWNNPSPGDHQISIRVTDSNGGVTTSMPVRVTSGISAGIHTVEMKGVVYPNPARSEITIETAIDLMSAKVTVINMLGEELELSSAVNGSGESIDVSTLKEGVYLLLIKKDNYLLREKISIIK